MVLGQRVGGPKFTVANLGTSFLGPIARFVHHGVTVQANTTALTVPTALASSVLTVTGLDTSPSYKKTLASTPAAAPPAGYVNGRPCSAFYGQLSAAAQTPTSWSPSPSW